MTARITLVSVCLLACTGVREPTAPGPPATPAESPDYAVYDAVLDGLASAYVPSGEQPYYVVIDATVIGRQDTAFLSAPSHERSFGPLLAPHVAATLADYLERGQSRARLDAHAFKARGRVELVTPEALAALVTSPAGPNEYWRAFYARFPGSTGSISFSRPGYDATRNHALLHYGHRCGGRCGDGGYVLLERRDDKWVVLRRVVTWMS
jgi:hypothetical protein